MRARRFREAPPAPPRAKLGDRLAALIQRRPGRTAGQLATELGASAAQVRAAATNGRHAGRVDPRRDEDGVMRYWPAEEPKAAPDGVGFALGAEQRRENCMLVIAVPPRSPAVMAFASAARRLTPPRGTPAGAAESMADLLDVELDEAGWRRVAGVLGIAVPPATQIKVQSTAKDWEAASGGTTEEHRRQLALKSACRRATARWVLNGARDRIARTEVERAIAAAQAEGGAHAGARGEAP